MPPPLRPACPPNLPTKPAFWGFCRDQFVAEHPQPLNVGLHIAGSVAGPVAGTVFLPVAPASPMPWLALLYPAVHAAPGLLGRRLFERNAVVGD